MNLNIKATNTTITPAIRESIETKVSVIATFLRESDNVHVEIEVDLRHQSGETNRVEIRVNPQGYYAEASGSDLYEALDLALPKIKEQLVKNKDKRISLRRKLGALFKRSK